MNKKIIILIILTSIIWVIFLWIKLIKKNTLNIEEIKKSIVIIIPENNLISYNNNPKWLFEDFKESGIWAWFFINSKWIIQTVNHIVENDKINYKILYNDKEYDWEIIYRDEENDLATIKIVSKDEVFPFLSKWNFSIWTKQNIYSFWVDKEKFEIIYNTWVINKKIKLKNKFSLIEISNNIKPWFSWWPIINSEWKVIWINYAISEWKKYGINLLK